MKINTIILVFFCICTSNGQQSFEDFKRQQEKEFNQFKQTVEAEYNDFKTREQRELKRFKKNVEKQWEDFKGSTAKVYVVYDDDLKSRGSIDFESGEVMIEVVIDYEDINKGFLDDHLDPVMLQYGWQPRRVFSSSLFFFSSFLVSVFPQTADHVYRELAQNNAEPIFQELAETRLFKKLVKMLSEKDDSGEFLLENQLEDNISLKDPKNVKQFAMATIKKTTRGFREYVGRDGKQKKSFSLNFPLRSDHGSIRSNKYGKEILKQSKRFNIDPSISMAVTETESSFNPKATSHIPAYGLMQLVPSSGGRDAYKYVYGKDKFLGKRYLYKPSNNIELGCAYLGKIRYQYFKGIKDDEKAWMCTVAAYNTGAGNVSRALTNTTKLSPAIKKVNQMSSKKLYKTLLKDLEHEETRNYLKKVWERKEKYKS